LHAFLKSLNAFSPVTFIRTRKTAPLLPHTSALPMTLMTINRAGYQATGDGISTQQPPWLR